MGYFESWKELILHPGKGVVKRKKGFDTAQIAMLLLITAFVGSFVVAFGTGAQLETMLNVDAPMMFAAMLVYSIADKLLLFFCIHHAARALGGNGSFRGLLSAQLEAILPFSILTLVYFVPYIGFALGVVAGLASLSVWIVVFKYLRLVYGLSVKRALAAILVPAVLLGIIICAIFFAAAFFSLAAGASANSPTITQTASGSHLYSPMYGGYSFDFPAGWRYVDLANETGIPLLGTLMRNSVMGADVMMNVKTNSSAIVAFEMSRGSGPAWSAEICNNETIRKGYLKGIDTRAAVAEYGSLGNLEGCLMRNLRNIKSGEASVFFVTRDCSEKYETAITTSEKDIGALKWIAESMRCGNDAVK